jgi:homoserine O-acetyltransferase
MQLEHQSNKNFPLESGHVLASAVNAYTTLGRLSEDGCNAILITHGFTEGPHFLDPDTRGSEGSWSSLVGPGRAVDTNRWFVICINMLGSCYGSTGPASRDPATGRPYGPAFPPICFADMVRLQRVLLDSLGVRRLIAVIGPSFGGFQAFQWSVTFPKYVLGVVPTLTGIRGTAGICESLRAYLANDPSWFDGNYYESGGVTGTLVGLRIKTLKHYGIDAQLREKFSETSSREIEIHSRAHRWAQSFDANSLLTIGRAAEMFNIDGQLSRIEARVLYVLSRTDQLYPVSLAPRVMEKLRAAHIDAEYIELDSEHGHFAAGIDAEKWGLQLSRFLKSLEIE